VTCDNKPERSDTSDNDYVQVNILIKKNDSDGTNATESSDSNADSETGGGYEKN
jgi:hypothetical protein